MRATRPGASADAPRELDERLHDQLVALRALCGLVASGGAMTRAGSITVRTGSPTASGIDLLRAAERIAAEAGVSQRVQLQGGLGTVHVWREDATA